MDNKDRYFYPIKFFSKILSPCFSFGPIDFLMEKISPRRSFTFAFGYCEMETPGKRSVLLDPELKTKFMCPGVFGANTHQGCD
jgi:hypothetical protein